jgi:hypothetical protein
MLNPARCPACDADFQGASIWETMLEKSNGDQAEADRKAEMYGADRSQGHFSRVIALYDMGADRVSYYHCPDCEHTWKRED